MAISESAPRLRKTSWPWVLKNGGNLCKAASSVGFIRRVSVMGKMKVGTRLLEGRWYARAVDKSSATVGR